jgi:hypothetical protein
MLFTSYLNKLSERNNAKDHNSAHTANEQQLKLQVADETLIIKT